MAEKTLNTRQKQKYDTSINWTSNNPVLLAGEIGIESDTNKMKVGDGTTAWNNLEYFSGGSLILYNTTGQNTDGAMTQKAVTDAIPTTLSDLTEDSTHRLVTDTQKATWNAKSDFSGSYNDLTNKPTIPTLTSQLTNDSNFVSDSAYVHTDNNYTTEEKNKLAGIEAGAEVNTVTSVAGKTGTVVLTATDVGALPDSTFVSTININGQPQTTINFNSDPQTQISNKVDALHEGSQGTAKIEYNDFGIRISNTLNNGGGVYTAFSQMLSDAGIYVMDSNTDAPIAVRVHIGETDDEGIIHSTFDVASYSMFPTFQVIPVEDIVNIRGEIRLGDRSTNLYGTITYNGSTDTFSI